MPTNQQTDIPSCMCVITALSIPCTSYNTHVYGLCWDYNTGYWYHRENWTEWIHHNRSGNYDFSSANISIHFSSVFFRHQRSHCLKVHIHVVCFYRYCMAEVNLENLLSNTNRKFSCFLSDEFYETAHCLTIEFIHLGVVIYQNVSIIDILMNYGFVSSMEFVNSLYPVEFYLIIPHIQF